MVLTDLPNFKKWLSQFDDKDKFYAKTLVESLIYISTDEFINSMKKQLDEYIKEKINEKIAFFAVRDLKYKNNKIDEPPYFPDKTSKPNKININMGVGSPGEVIHFIRDYCKNNPNFFDHPSLNSMKVNKVRHIFFINDIGCSGTQIHDFIDFFLENKTICSWWSSKKIQFHVYSHCLSKQGKSKIGNNKFISKENIISTIKAKNGSKEWSKQLKTKINDFCLKYGNKIDPDTALGYADSFGIYVYSHKCPNNVPNIIWETKNGWIPLINTRPNFDFISYISNTFLQIQILYKKLIIQIEKKKYLLSPETKKSILVLKYLQKYKYNKDSITQFLDLNYFQYKYYITELKRFGWIDNDSKITKEGKKVLYLLNKKNIKKSKVVEENSDFYYPTSLQAPDY